MIVTSGVRGLSGDYPVWLVDVWGVVHNGEAAFDASLDALERHRNDGGTVVLITNAPRPSAIVEVQLTQMQVMAGRHYDAIVSSGDATRALVKNYAGGKVYHLGPAKDLGLLEGLSVTFSGPDEADVVLCSGLLDDENEQPQDYDTQLQALVKQGLNMICANPDKVVRKGDRLLPCAGALAARYEEMGGTVMMAGKPFAPIYNEALRLAGVKRNDNIDKKTVLAIGDGVATDARGALLNQLDLLFIGGGIHEAELGKSGNEGLIKLVKTALPEIRLAGAMYELIW